MHREEMKEALLEVRRIKIRIFFVASLLTLGVVCAGLWVDFLFPLVPCCGW